MTRLLLVVGPSTGGIGRHVSQLAQRADADGYEVWVAAPGETLRRFGLDATAYGNIDMRRRGAMARLGVAARRSAVVHAHGLTAATWAGLATPWQRPLVATWHNALRSGGTPTRLDRAVQTYVARRCDLNLCVSSDLVATVDAARGSARLAPVGPARLPRPAHTRTAVRREMGLSQRRRLILCLARLHPQKGIDVLLRAVAASAVPCSVAIAGVGPAEAELRALAADLAVDVRWLGLRRDVSDLLHAADLFVMPSRWEGSPLALHEAYQAGVPTVATDVGGIAELSQGATELVPSEDVAALTRAIERVLIDDATRADLRQGGKAALVRWPDGEQATRAVLATYSELIAR